MKRRPNVLFLLSDQHNRNIADLTENSSIVSDLHSRLWSDGETWESLFAKRESCRAEASKERLAEEHTPNQYALCDGSLIDAEADLYSGGYLNA